VLRVGAEVTEAYFHMLEGKRIGVVGNQSSLIGQTHLVDSLLGSGLNVIKVFSPEHGFRGDADAGELVGSGKDVRTGLPIVSLYGKNKKPKQSQLDGVDIILFDIQDVGARFYTYISTLHYVLEACGEADIPVVILDRPNPNGHYVDGPVLEKEFKSFVGMHPVPIVHGMTIGEYGKMILGEKWVSTGEEFSLTVIKCEGYTHNMAYSLPVQPSPNLRSDLSIQLYPSLCLLEGTAVSCGRGTDGPFERFGHPDFPETGFSFTPKAGYGSMTPKFLNQKCNWINLKETGFERATEFDLRFLFQADSLLNGNLFKDKKPIFNLLAGNDQLWRQVNDGMTEKEIRESWEPELRAYKEMRKNYLLYED